MTRFRVVGTAVITLLLATSLAIASQRHKPNIPPDRSRSYCRCPLAPLSTSSHA